MVGAVAGVRRPPSVAMIVYGWIMWTSFDAMAFRRAVCRARVWVARGPEKSVWGGRRSKLMGGRVGVCVVQCWVDVRSWDWGVRDHVATVYMEVISRCWSWRAEFWEWSVSSGKGMSWVGGGRCGVREAKVVGDGRGEG